MLIFKYEAGAETEIRAVLLLQCAIPSFDVPINSAATVVCAIGRSMLYSVVVLNNNNNNDGDDRGGD